MRPALGLGLLLYIASLAISTASADESLHFTARTRHEISPKSGRFEVIEQPREWDPRHTAVIICDLWDKHWCDGATHRVGLMAPRINDLVKAIRAKGGLIVHAPSDTMKYYEETPQRKLAQSAPAAPSTRPFAWNKIDLSVEPPLPIDDSDGGCDSPNCKTYRAWTREISVVEVADNDAVSDSGQEIYNLFKQRGIENVLLCGVHLNMCVLGRSFGIRQLSRSGLNVMLVRDLTDTMYNPKMSPFVPHERGTDLMIEHVEKYWCPSILSSDVLGDPKPAHVVVAISEDEYHAKESLPPFVRDELAVKLGMDVKIIQSDSKTDLPGVEAIDQADLLVLFMRRRTLPDDQLAHFKRYFESGKPVVAIRTSCHAFQNWLSFDAEVLGVHYGNHYGNTGGLTVSVAPDAASDPLLRGVMPTFASTCSLYKTTPLEKTATPLLLGTWTDKTPEPVAVINTHQAGRIFFTSLGNTADFENPAFRRLLSNGVLWALDRPIPQPTQPSSARR